MAWPIPLGLRDGIAKAFKSASIAICGAAKKCAARGSGTPRVKRVNRDFSADVFGLRV